MRYVKGFFLFWRNFVVGSDWMLAATVAWSLAFVYELINFNINAWYLVPILVVLALIVSVRHELSAHFRLQMPAWVQFVRGNPLFWLMGLVAVVPLGTFRIIHNDMAMEHFTLPVLFAAAAVATAALCSAWFYVRWPFGTSLIMLAGSIQFVERVQPRLQMLSENVAQYQGASGLIVTAALIVVAGFGTLAASLVVHARHQ